VDAFVVSGDSGHRVYALENADLPYSLLVETMREGAAVLNGDGNLIYCNDHLAKLLGAQREALVGIRLEAIVEEADVRRLRKILAEVQHSPTQLEVLLKHNGSAPVAVKLSFQMLSQDPVTIGALVTDLTPQKQLAKLVLRLQLIRDEERRRLARELHDSIGQLLAALAMNIGQVELENHRLSPERASIVTENKSIVNEISSEIRTISHLLHPPLLDEVGLPSALRWYINGFSKRSHIDTTLEIPDDFERLPQDVEISVFRVVQECLSNVHHHSGSDSCVIRILRDAEGLIVEIADRGRGIPKEKLANLASLPGVGLRGMEERVRQLGGRLDIASSDQGTSVKMRLSLLGPEDGVDNGTNAA